MELYNFSFPFIFFMSVCMYEYACAMALMWRPKNMMWGWRSLCHHVGSRGQTQAIRLYGKQPHLLSFTLSFSLKKKTANSND